VPDYIAEDPLIKAMGVTRDQVVDALRAVSFTDDLLVSFGFPVFVAGVLVYILNEFESTNSGLRGGGAAC
jgi:hypothetical protein